MTRNLAILLFDDVEELDFCGPFEVFNLVNEVTGEQYFNVFTVAANHRLVKTHNNLQVMPDFSLSAGPEPDILVIPGGIGSRAALRDEMVMRWLKTLAPRVELLLSVCTGALILAEAGLLDGLQATTHHTCFDELAERAPQASLVRDVKYVDNGPIILSGGISAGIDMSLYVVARLIDHATAVMVAREMEYDWAGPGNQNPPVPVE